MPISLVAVDVDVDVVDDGVCGVQSTHLKDNELKWCARSNVQGS